MKLYLVFDRLGPGANGPSRHQLEHPTFNQPFAEMIVEMPNELLPGIELASAEQLFDALDYRASFFTRRRVGHRGRTAAFEREKQQADLIV